MSADTNAGGWPDAELEARIFMSTGVKAEGANRLLVYRIAKLVRAREAAAALAMREAAAEYADKEEAYSSKRAETENHHDQVWFGSSAATAGSIASHIRALPLPASAQAALDAVVREARERAIKEAATHLLNNMDKDDWRAREKAVDMLRELAEAPAIRARGEAE